MLFIVYSTWNLFHFYCGVSVDVLKWAPRSREQIANIDFNFAPSLGQYVRDLHGD